MAFVDLIGLGSRADLRTGYGEDVLPVRRGYRQVKRGRSTPEPGRKIDVSGTTTVGVGLVRIWREKLRFFKLRVGAGVLGEAANSIPGTMVPPDPVPTRAALGAVACLGIKNTITEGTPRVRLIVGEKQTSAKLSGELDGFPSEIELL